VLLAKPDSKRVDDAATRDTRPTAIIIGAQPEETARIGDQIADLARVVGSTPDPIEGLREARAAAPALAILCVDHSPDTAMAAAEELAQSLGHAVIIVSRDRDPDLIVRAMRAGARDFAYLDPDGDVRRAVAALRPTAEPALAEPGQVIAVFGAKGGSGVTTIAANLAGALLPADGDDERTVLVDLDFQMGDAMVFLDLSGGFGWRELVRDRDRLDDELLDKLLIRHDSGLRVVAQTAPIDDAEPIAPSVLASAIDQLRHHTHHIVIDGLGEFDDVTLAALDLADTVLLVFTQDIPSLKNASRSIAIFRRLGYGNDKIKLVVNRYNKRGKLTLEEIEDALGAPVSATIANDYPTVVGAINAGRLLIDTAPRARVTRDIRALAALLEPEAPTPRRRFFGKGGWS
jgi:pilus assembly protein CpaE